MRKDKSVFASDLILSLAIVDQRILLRDDILKNKVLWTCLKAVWYPGNTYAPHKPLTDRKHESIDLAMTLSLPRLIERP